MMQNFTRYLVALILSGPLSLHAQNLLSNGSFEQDFTSWNNLVGTGTVGTFSISETEKEDGLRSMKVEIVQPGAQAYEIQSLGPVWSSEPGKEYKISLFAKGLVAGSKFKAINQVSSTYREDFVVVTADWKEYTYNYTAPVADLQFKIHFPEAGTFFIDNITITPIVPIVPVTVADSLRVLVSNCGINLGAAVEYDPLQVEQNYINALKQQFNILTPGNEMKMESLKPTETGDYNWALADKIVEFALANKMKVRGHTLLWHNQVPSWFRNKSWNKETMLAALKTHITTVVGRYKGKIAEWDVVNEAISDASGNALRDTLWFRTIGREVLDSAFTWAHNADPAAKLFYNDYYIEGLNAKAIKAYELVKGLKDRGAPINGVGFQAHLEHTANAVFFNELDLNIKKYTAIGLKVAITELDVRIPDADAAPQKYINEGHIYGQVLKVALQNRPTVETFVIWGITDKYSWIPGVFPGTGEALMFDKNYNPKPAFDSVVSVLKRTCLKVTALEDADESLSESIRYYPNPFSESASIKVPGLFNYEVYDLTGRQITASSATDVAYVGDSLPEGIYTVKVIQKNKIQTFKICKGK